jgi:hypothetical protein
VHERSARVACVMEPDMADARGLEHSRPPRRQGLRTESTPRFVYNHVAARCVVFAERQTVGALDGPGGTQCGGQVFSDRKRSPSCTALRRLLNKVLGEPEPGRRDLRRSCFKIDVTVWGSGVRFSLVPLRSMPRPTRRTCPR